MCPAPQGNCRLPPPVPQRQILSLFFPSPPLFFVVSLSYTLFLETVCPTSPLSYAPPPDAPLVLLCYILFRWSAHYWALAILFLPPPFFSMLGFSLSLLISPLSPPYPSRDDSSPTSKAPIRPTWRPSFFCFSRALAPRAPHRPSLGIDFRLPKNLLRILGGHISGKIFSPQRFPFFSGISGPPTP